MTTGDRPPLHRHRHHRDVAGLLHAADGSQLPPPRPARLPGVGPVLPPAHRPGRSSRRTCRRSTRSCSRTCTATTSTGSPRAARPRRRRCSPPPHAVRRLGSWGFDARALQTWEQHVLVKGDEELRRHRRARPIHARGLLGRMLPPVMGSIIDHSWAGEYDARVYLSGDTLTGDHVDEVARALPRHRRAVVHLGGTRVLLRTVTMDGPMGVDFVERVRPRCRVPVHHDDYTVFRSPLSRLRRPGRARASGRLRCPTAVAREPRPGPRGEARQPRVRPCRRSTGRPSSGATRRRIVGLGARPSSSASSRR